MVIAILMKNVDTAKGIIKEATAILNSERKCHCPKALEGAIITDPKAISEETKKRLGLIIGKYIK